MTTPRPFCGTESSILHLARWAKCWKLKMAGKQWQTMAGKHINFYTTSTQTSQHLVDFPWWPAWRWELCHLKATNEPCRCYARLRSAPRFPFQVRFSTKSVWILILWFIFDLSLIYRWFIFDLMTRNGLNRPDHRSASGSKPDTWRDVWQQMVRICEEMVMVRQRKQFQRTHVSGNRQRTRISGTRTSKSS